METLIQIGLATCVFGIIAGASVLLYRFIEMLLDYLDCGRTGAGRRFANAKDHVSAGGPILDDETSESVQQILTVARREGS